MLEQMAAPMIFPSLTSLYLYNNHIESIEQIARMHIHNLKALSLGTILLT